ncbi:phosphoribosylanthranilate isomerase [Haloarchaeobius sp. HME9146]|uniref:phosphoribosylanthranilate isomerase n=1 Tax=Haloarchaeobius sp. HME9146 TaxID=2978732 RepID=UPI0021C0105C|nr:phosphoribosylanthranilate isomerase [Haloarchaeobius sp. HME9146]MCT9097481.1 phosphoribosylanthranilate isomerase [Haloarchaeobius sp. HME9146]
MTRVKICGLTREEDVDAAVAAGADALGFVVDVPVDTPREVTVERAAELIDRVPPFVTTVVVTMPETPGEAIELVRELGPDALQVHSDLTPGDVAYLQSNLDVPVIKHVDAANPADARRYADVADAVLVDSVDEEGAGGTGRTHDWEQTREALADIDVPVILAGGLTPENVAEAVVTVEPFAVDVASGVESSGGVKDHDAIRRFVVAATERRRSLQA